MAMTSINSADGATPKCLFKMPRFAEMRAKGIMSLSTSSPPWENGSKMGINLYTLSKLNDETDAIFPVLKNADCSRVRKKIEIRASDSVSDLNGEDDSEAGITALPFV